MTSQNQTRVLAKRSDKVLRTWTIGTTMLSPVWPGLASPDSLVVNLHGLRSVKGVAMNNKGFPADNDPLLKESFVPLTSQPLPLSPCA
jgi:hypothetical protein